MKPASNRLEWTSVERKVTCPECSGAGFVGVFSLSVFRFFNCGICKGNRFVMEVTHQLRPVEPQLHEGCGVWMTNEF
jgi:transcription elongation factor Elf1